MKEETEKEEKQSIGDGSLERIREAMNEQADWLLALAFEDFVQKEMKRRE